MKGEEEGRGGQGARALKGGGRRLREHGKQTESNPYRVEGGEAGKARWWGVGGVIPGRI